MENIFHFQGKRRLSSMAKQYTIQPCFSDNESNSSSEENEKDSTTNSPMLPTKKSHFSPLKTNNSPKIEPIGSNNLSIFFENHGNFCKVQGLAELSGKIKEKRRLKPHTFTEIPMKKKTDVFSMEEHKPSIRDLTASQQNPKLINEEQKKEVLSVFAQKNKAKLQVNTANLMGSEPTTTEIQSSDKVKELNKVKNTEKIISSHSFRCLIFSPIVTESVFKRHLTLTYRGLIYAKKCLKEPSKAFIKSKLVNLVDTKPQKNKTLLLDLDETIVHTSMLMSHNGVTPLKDHPDHIIKTIGEYGEDLVFGLNIRPYCYEFLEKLAKLYEIFVFTASSPNYANAIVNFIDPQKILINGILTRENCLQTKNGFFIKDLRVINNRNLKNMIIVDNLSHSFGFQIENGVPILEFHNDRKDKELKFLQNYLIEAWECEDMREFNRKKLRLQELADMKIEDLNI